MRPTSAPSTGKSRVLPSPRDPDLPSPPHQKPSHQVTSHCLLANSQVCSPSWSPLPPQAPELSKATAAPNSPLCTHHSSSLRHSTHASRGNCHFQTQDFPIPTSLHHPYPQDPDPSMQTEVSLPLPQLPVWLPAKLPPPCSPQTDRWPEWSLWKQWRVAWLKPGGHLGGVDSLLFFHCHNSEV